VVTSARNLDDDGGLVIAVQEGDLDAFSELFRRHYPSVRRACTRRLRDPFEAEEVAQAAFVRALERIASCDGERHFGRWVHVIARHLCVDAMRAQARVEPREQPFDGRPEHRPNEPEESLLTAERAAHVQAALGALPERQRHAVIARDCDDLRPPEIADRLGLSVGAVDSLLLRARRRLARAYRHVAGEGGGAATAITSAAASVGATMLVRPATVVSGAVAAAHAVQETATEVADTVSSLPGARAAGGVVSAVVGAAMALTGGTASPPAGPVPERPPAVVVVEPAVTPPVGLPDRSAASGGAAAADGLQAGDAAASAPARLDQATANLPTTVLPATTTTAPAQSPAGGPGAGLASAIAPAAGAIDPVTSVAQSALGGAGPPPSAAPAPSGDPPAPAAPVGSSLVGAPSAAGQVVDQAVAPVTDGVSKATAVARGLPGLG
jgi:RNA polymerase sigma-70 factor (ECF subfamily)